MSTYYSHFLDASSSLFSSAPPSCRQHLDQLIREAGSGGKTKEDVKVCARTIIQCRYDGEVFPCSFTTYTQHQIDELVSSDCPYCGLMMIGSVSLPLIPVSSWEGTMSTWQ